MEKKYLMGLLLGACALMPAAAQDSPPVALEVTSLCDTVCHEPARVVLLVGNKAVKDEIMKMFYDTRSLHFQDPRAPRFLFIDQKGRAALGIGGYVKGTMSYDFNGISDSKDFIPFDIPAPSNPAERSQFQMDASTTRIFLKLVGNNNLMGKYMAYIETDFRGGNSNSLRLRQAYIKMRHVQAGLAWSTFVDAVAGPPTIDYQGPNGEVSVRNVMLQYFGNIGSRWSYAVAAEAPSVSYTTVNAKSSYIKQRMPDIPLYLQYGWNENNNHIRVSGLFRGLSYRNLVTHKNLMKLGWAVQLTGLANITPKLLFYYEGVYGRGYGEYVDDLSGNGVDLIPDARREGDMKAPESWGVVGGLQYNFTPSLFISASYSQCRLYGAETLGPQGYKYGQSFVGNIFYNLTKDCQIGAEYLFGRRVNQNEQKGSANRLNAMIQYNF